MASLSYDEIFSSFYTSIDDYNLMSLAQSDAYMHMTDYLRKTLSRPFVRRMFTTVTRDDEVQVLEYELERENTTDLQADEDFVVMMLSKGMVYEWASPKVESMKHMSQLIATADEKLYSQAQHLSQLRNLRDDMYAELQRLISDRGFSDNSYLDGTSAAATQRQVTTS